MKQEPRQVCPVCAARHYPEELHDLGSPYYQYMFRRIWGRPPTWEDAMGHCTEEKKAAYKAELGREEHGKMRK